jgi:hypothetical protein
MPGLSGFLWLATSPFRGVCGDRFDAESIRSLMAGLLSVAYTAVFQINIQFYPGDLRTFKREHVRLRYLLGLVSCVCATCIVVMACFCCRPRYAKARGS